MDKNYHVSGSQMDGESFKQKDDDQSEKDEKSEKGEKSFHTFISFEGCGHVIFLQRMMYLHQMQMSASMLGSGISCMRHKA